MFYGIFLLCLSINQNVKLNIIIMKCINYLLLITFCSSILFACGNNSHKEAPQMMSDYASSEVSAGNVDELDDQKVLAVHRSASSGLAQPNYLATSAASTAFDDGVHKFIRIARTKFKVKDVVLATQGIEDIVLKNKGFILKSFVKNNNVNQRTLDISKDSAVIICQSTLTANLQMKVPSHLLDTTLRQIAPLVKIVDYRIVEAEDVTAKLMAEELVQIRLAKKQKRISNAINTRSGKLDDAIDAENTLDSSLEEADNRKIAEYNLNEQIAYSLITIELYQDNVEYARRILKENDAYEVYKPGFGEQILDALGNGWLIVSDIFIFLISIWPILLMVVAGIVVFQKIRKKKE